MSLTRVACVEDDPDIRVLTEIALSAIGGFETRTYGSGPDALAGLPEYLPQLVILDVMMPGMDGKDLFRRLSGHPALSHVPVIFMTAKSMASETAELLALGAIGVISKPYDPVTVSDEIRALWSERPSLVA